MHLGYLLSWLHPILVHFPIALLLSALGAETIGLLARRPGFSAAAKGLLIAGCVISLFAFVSGNFAEVFAVRGGTPHDPVDRHGIWAMITTWAFILVTIARCYLTPDSRAFKFYFTGLLIASCLLVYTGHQGGSLVYDHGANVLAEHRTHAFDMKDLQDLYQEQNAESIVYSEMMHHIFGWLVLALSLFLIATKLWPEQTKKLWRGGPFVLLAGGVFLMIFSDTDSWPLSNARPIYDKEVLQHKIFATLMLLAGSISLMKKKKQEGAPPAASYHLGLALLALVGGGLLFTHVHSVAPYSNRAVGVYLHHLTMGFVALCAGCASFWEAIRARGPRWRTYLWPSILLVESVLLINYNENIPWFVTAFASDTPQLLHEARYDLQVETAPQQLRGEEPSELRFIPKDLQGGGAVPELEIRHENPLHLMIVSKDLSFFDHVHPAMQKDGSLVLKYHFPHGGEFFLFADMVPRGSLTQSFVHRVQVEGIAPPPVALVENVYATAQVGKRKVLLFTQPIILAPGQPSRLRFALYDENERGLSDLELFLGCFGHCVIASEDGRYYLHAHPEGHDHSSSAKPSAVSLEPVVNAEDKLPDLGKDRQMMFTMGMTSPGMTFAGPEIVFPVTFPQSGLYKVWGQFRHRGEVITVPFVLRVP